MDYPRDFPEHLKAKVDGAIHDAELEFLKSRAERYRSTRDETEKLIINYVRKIWFAFAYQTCRAWEEGPWNGERVRQAQSKYREDLIHWAYYEKHPSPNDLSQRTIRAGVKTTIEDSPEFASLQTEMKRVAELRAGNVQFPGPVQRQAYRKEIRAWMSRTGLTSVKEAAKRLGISDSVLKSMMTNAGKKRYSPETLDRTLKAIRPNTGYQSGDQP